MELKKYEFTGKTMPYCGRVSHQIRAIKDFNSIKVGDVGGWIEKERNLSHEGDCWVLDNAKVLDNARISDNAEIWGNSTICGGAEIWGNAGIWGNAIISSNAEIRNNAEIWGNAEIRGNAIISGNARVYDNAGIWGNAEISDNAIISGNAEIWGASTIRGDAEIASNKHYLTVYPIGHNGETITFFRNNSKKITANCSMFFGDIDDFSKMLDENYKDKVFAGEYKAVIELAKSKIDLS